MSTECNTAVFSVGQISLDACYKLISVTLVGLKWDVI